jgi:hypothetical protein
MWNTDLNINVAVLENTGQTRDIKHRKNRETQNLYVVHILSIQE